MLTKLMDSPESDSDSTLDNLASQTTSRRTLLAGGLTAALAGVAGIAAAKQDRDIMPQNGYNPLKKPAVTRGGTSTTVHGAGTSSGAGTSAIGRFWSDDSKKLLRRVTYGATPDDILEIQTLGYNAYLEKQLDSASIDDSACEALIDSLAPRMRMSLTTLNGFTGSASFNTIIHARHALAIRAIRSKRQLHQRMNEFLIDHFYIGEKPLYGAVLDYYRGMHAIALTSFRDILVYTANHGAMMDYLDNMSSTGSDINVNYAREILELHTVGIDGGYTEADIYEVAKIFTGWWTPAWQDDPINSGVFQYKSQYKLPGNRTVMGQSFNQSGKAQGDALLNWLAAHPETIKFVCAKMCRFFLGHNPDASLMSALATAWGTTGDIKAILRVMLSQANIKKITPKFKRPFHLVMGAMRHLDMDFTTVSGLLDQNYMMSHDPFRWGQPNGYPDTFAHWAAGMVPRLNFALGIVNRQVWGTFPFDYSVFTGMTDPQRMDWINQRLFLGELPLSDQIWIRRYLKGSTTTRRAQEAVAIALASPTYQWF